MRVNQSKSRKDKFVDSPSDSLPRERPDAPTDNGHQDHLTPSIYGITPEHVTMDVLELYDGPSALFPQYAISTDCALERVYHLNEDFHNPPIMLMHGTIF